jgi:glycosyltransferase involved in cell wall biosynthesis
MTITETESITAIQEYNIPPEKVIVVGRGVNRAFEYPIRLADGIPVQLENIYSSHTTKEIWGQWWNGGAFTYMGRLKEIKGINLIVCAWYKLYCQYKDNTPPLWIIGGSPSEIQDMRQIITKNIPQLEQIERSYKIIWWGYLDPKGISTLLLKTLALVTHAQFEAGGRVIIEAMSASTPVISTPTGFGKDYIRDWYNGFLVQYNDIEQLAIRMNHFIRLPLISSLLGRSAADTYKRMKANWNCYDKHMKVYHFAYESGDNAQLTLENNSIIENYYDYFAYGCLIDSSIYKSDENFFEMKLKMLLRVS